MALESHFDFGEGMFRAVSAQNPEYPRGYVWNANNIVYDGESEEPEKMKGYTRLGTTAMGGRCQGLFDYKAGTRLISAQSDGKIYEYAGTDFAVATGGTGFSTSSSTRWAGAMFYGAVTADSILVLANGVDTPKKYTSAAGVSALGGTPPSTGRFPTSFVGRMWMAGNGTNGSTLFFSKINDCEVWAAPDGGSILIDGGEGGEITGLYAYKDNLIVFKRGRVYRLGLDFSKLIGVAGDAPTIGSGGALASAYVTRISTHVGTLSHFSIQEAANLNQGILLFRADEGIVAGIPSDSTGGFYFENVSNPIDSVLGNQDLTTPTACWATYNPQRKEYYFQFPTSGETPSGGAIANVARPRKKVRWTQHDISSMTAGGLYTVTGTQIQVMGDTSGKVWRMHNGYQRDSGAYTGQILTRIYTQGHFGYIKQYNRFFVDTEVFGSYSVNVQVQLGRVSMPSPATETLTASGSSGNWLRPTTVGRGNYVRFQIDTTGADERFKLNGIDIEASVTSENRREGAT